MNENEYSKTKYLCWRECELEAGHAHIYRECNKIVRFWGMVQNVMQKILGYNIPMNCETLYMCNLNEGHILIGDRYLVKILLIASKKAITTNWCKVDPPNQDQWMAIVDQIYIMEKMTFRMRLQEVQGEQKWEKLTIYKNTNSDRPEDLGNED